MNKWLYWNKEHSNLLAESHPHYPERNTTSASQLFTLVAQNCAVKLYSQNFNGIRDEGEKEIIKQIKRLGNARLFFIKLSLIKRFWKLNRI